ncbi:MAG: hypothetical protein ACM3N0_10535 [Chloroflexota bacterium]
MGPKRLLTGCLLLALALAGLLGAAGAQAGPATTRYAYGTGEIVPIPAAIPHEEGDMVDRRIVPDLRWIAQRFPIYITDGYSGPLPNGEHVGCNGCHVKHSDHYNGLAVDIVPVGGSSKCDASWRGITRLAKWAEPRQNHPVPPFRWVGYNGDPGHGCGNHLHLSWEHAPAPQFQLAEWVEVFPVGPGETGQAKRKRHKRPAKQDGGSAGGVSTFQSGGVSATGD